MDQIHVCRDFGDEDWKKLSERLKAQPNDRDWKHAIDVFDALKRRYFHRCRGRIYLPSHLTSAAECNLKETRPMPQPKRRNSSIGPRYTD